MGSTSPKISRPARVSNSSRPHKGLVKWLNEHAINRARSRSQQAGSDAHRGRGRHVALVCDRQGVPNASHGWLTTRDRHAAASRSGWRSRPSLLLGAGMRARSCGRVIRSAGSPIQRRRGDTGGSATRRQPTRRTSRRVAKPCDPIPMLVRRRIWIWMGGRMRLRHLQRCYERRMCSRFLGSARIWGLSRKCKRRYVSDIRGCHKISQLRTRHALIAPFKPLWGGARSPARRLDWSVGAGARHDACCGCCAETLPNRRREARTVLVAACQDGHRIQRACDGPSVFSIPRTCTMRAIVYYRRLARTRLAPDQD